MSENSPQATKAPNSQISQISKSVWKHCNTCKREVAYKSPYYVCNVSTCNRKRTGLVFCSVSCWDAHLPLMNHREAWAEDRRAPSYEEALAILAEEAEPKKRTRSPQATEAPQAEKSFPRQSGPQVILRKR